LDYGQIEARVIAMASKDTNLVASLWHRGDIHMEWAEKFCKKFPKLGEPKAFRYFAKNKVVFPSFFGSKPRQIAKNLNIDEHGCEELFEDFWEKFSGVLQWQKSLLAFYSERGYVECLTGRRRRAPISYNRIINAPIQGTASDIVVDGMNRLSEKSQLLDNPQLQAVLNVHDDLTFYIESRQIDTVVPIVVTGMLDCSYDFINVPLSVEMSIGKDLYRMKEEDTFFSNEWL
jgi:DNA polymerase I-like protein with 3'-5' exonuclease and polymerase domains